MGLCGEKMTALQKKTKSVMRKYIVFLSGVIMLLAGGISEAGVIDVVFRDQNVRKSLLTLQEGRIEFVQLEKVSELFGIPYDIDPLDGRVVFGSGEKIASLFPGQDTVIADRRTYFLDSPPIRIEGVIMLPVEFLTKILPRIYEGDIAWDAQQNALIVGIQHLEIFNMYFSPFGDYTRVAIELNQATSYKITEKLPSMLLIDLPQATFDLAQNPLDIGSRAVKHVKVINMFGSTQIIVRLGDEFVRYTHQMTEEPARLLLDIYTLQDTLVEANSAEDILEEDLTTPSDSAVPATSTTTRRFSLQTVVIDPGHGGSDRGILVMPASEGMPELYEKQLTLHLAQILRTNLTQRLGVRVFLTREGDDFVSAESRATIANSNRADIFVSLHVNNSLFGDLAGFEAYVMDYGSLDVVEGQQDISAQTQLLDYAQAKYLDQSKRLAEEILAAYRTRNDGMRAVLKRAPLFTLKGATMPSVHIEVGYSSHEGDRIRITQEEFQRVLAATITDGIVTFKQKEEQ